jgi:hypothetical protein
MNKSTSRVDQFVGERLTQIDTVLSPEELRSLGEFAPYLGLSTDDELRELFTLLIRKDGGQISHDDMARAHAICQRIIERQVQDVAARVAQVGAA